MPRRPTNMPTRSTPWPNRLSSAVTPRSSPTVAKAEMQVNSISKNVKGSSPLRLLPILISSAIPRTNSSDPTVMPTARSTTLSAISRLRITTASRPRRVERVAAISAATVVVLMPPPVPPGLAPMNIKVISSNKPDSVMFSKDSGMVVKPAVRAVTDSNRAVIQRSDHVISMNTPPLFSHSVMARPRAPNPMRRKEVRNTSRECRLRRRRPRPRRNAWVARSLVTLQPRPPVMISTITTPFTTGLAW